MIFSVMGVETSGAFTSLGLAASAVSVANLSILVFSCVAASARSAASAAFVSASAIGYYGDRGDETLTEESQPGTADDFLVEVTKLWEKCLTILAGIVEDGVKQGHFRECDPWEVANVLWTVANGLLRTKWTPARAKLMRRSIEHAFGDAVDVFLRGLSV